VDRPALNRDGPALLQQRLEDCRQLGRVELERLHAALGRLDCPQTELEKAHQGGVLTVEITTQQKAPLQVEDRSTGVLRGDPLQTVVEGQLGKKRRMEGGGRRRRLQRESWLRR
jgi:hypothetical protein